MKLIFTLEYHTADGDTLCVVGNSPLLGNGNALKAPQMKELAPGDQRMEIELPAATTSLSYRYAVRSANGTIKREEWGGDRTISFDSHLQSALIEDHWRDRPTDAPFYSTMFSECVCRRSDTTPVRSLKPDTLRIEVDAAMVPRGMTLAFVGSEPETGAWDPCQAILMNGSKMPRWSVDLPLTRLTGKHLEYKFILINETNGEIAGWENGPNRSLYINQGNDSEAIVVSGLHFESPLAPWRGAGVAIPVFSLRSADDFGVGDFYDLKLMVDWAAMTGQTVIQILPINDTTMTHTWRDCYPYNANSCFALHPMYLRISEMGKFSNPAEEKHFGAMAKELNSLQTVDYEKVNAAKDMCTRRLFELHGKEDLKTPEFKKFYSSNSHWLKPYAAFCTLREKFRTSNMADWGEWATYSPSRTDMLMRKEREEFDYAFYIQFHLDRQLRHVCEYAHSKGVAIKGDIPIGISRTSVDAWTNPELFNLDCSAGAPPDPFATLGQNWGFPTYNWERMALDGYAWWKARLKKMSEYFQAYRIDHVLGFFRIWEIPVSQVHGLLGTFNPALPMSADQMLSDFGFAFESGWMTKPYATDETINQLFGDLMTDVRANYLIPSDYGTYNLDNNVATQRKAVETISQRNDLTESQRARLTEGMLTLLDQVLFIEDQRMPGHYHPRINGFDTTGFKHLSPEQQSAYRNLHEDFFYRRNNSFWRDKAMTKLPTIIDATSMLSCAEDLGMIPACVPEVMERLKILSLEIQRMPKAFEEFADPSRYPYLSVCTTSTHDMPPLRGWLSQDSERRTRFIEFLTGKSTTQEETALNLATIRQNLHAPSMLCILPLQDWLSISPELRHPDPSAEQINEPANAEHYWRYRMHLPIEKLLDSRQFNNSISNLIRESDR